MSPILTLRVIFLLILTSATASAFTLQGGRKENHLVGVSGLNEADWKSNEALCLMNNQEPDLCGRVVIKGPTNLIIQIVWSRNGIPKDGSTTFVARRVSPKILPNIPPLKLSQEVVTFIKIENIRTAVFLGVNLLRPFVQLEQKLTPKFTLGVKPFYTSSSAGAGSVSGIGATVMVGYYPSALFKGLTLQAGIGWLFYKAELIGLEESTSTLVAELWGGWTFMIKKKFPISVGVGSHFIFPKSLQNFTLNYNGFLPYALVRAGFAF